LLSVPEADALAQHAHGDVRGASGIRLIDHVRSVAARMRGDPDPHAVPAALLHDAVEKGAISWDDPRAAGANERLIAVVDALTKRDSESEDGSLARAATDPLALRIKHADITDKLDLRGRSILCEQARRAIEDRARRRLVRLEAIAAQHGSAHHPDHPV
jgi:(p)ppGpp synthase/HD superfamily hydrolase